MHLGAIVVVVGIPIGFLASMWGALTQPFWFNEYWRAYYISKPGDWWDPLRGDGAPFPAGWYFLERFAGQMFGSTELVLRIPTDAFLPIGCLLLYLLAKRWMPIPAAIAVTLVGGLSGQLLGYSVQLSEYVIDSAAACAVLLVHELADERNDLRRSRWDVLVLISCYAAIAISCIFSTPIVFLAGPILLFDLFRLVRQRFFGLHLIIVIVTGAIVLAHIGLFIIRQNALTHSSYWNSQFLPRHGFMTSLSFVWNGFSGFISTSFITASFSPSLSGAIPSLNDVLRVLWTIFLVIGSIAAARSRRGRTLLVGIVGSFIVTLVASAVRYWPFGAVRVNLYEVPLLVLLAGIGATQAVRFCTARWRRARVQIHRPKWSTAGLRLAAGALAAIGMTAALIAGFLNGAAYADLHSSANGTGYGAHERSGVAWVNRDFHGNSAVVVVGVMAISGWKYYSGEYTGNAVIPANRVPDNRVLYSSTSGSTRITSFLAHLHPNTVYLYIPMGTTGDELGLDIHAMALAGVCKTVGTTQLLDSGLIVTLARSAVCSG